MEGDGVLEASTADVAVPPSASLSASADVATTSANGDSDGAIVSDVVDPSDISQAAGHPHVVADAEMASMGLAAGSSVPAPAALLRGDHDVPDDQPHHTQEHLIHETHEMERHHLEHATDSHMPHAPRTGEEPDAVEERPITKKRRGRPRGKTKQSIKMLEEKQGPVKAKELRERIRQAISKFKNPSGKSLSDHTRRLLLVMVLSHLHNNLDSSVTNSINEIARLTHVSRNSVRSAYDEFKQHGELRPRAEKEKPASAPQPLHHQHHHHQHQHHHQQQQQPAHSQPASGQISQSTMHMAPQHHHHHLPHHPQQHAHSGQPDMSYLPTSYVGAYGSSHAQPRRGMAASSSAVDVPPPAPTSHLYSHIAGAIMVQPGQHPGSAMLSIQQSAPPPHSLFVPSQMFGSMPSSHQ